MHIFGEKQKTSSLKIKLYNSCKVGKSGLFGYDVVNLLWDDTNVPGNKSSGSSTCIKRTLRMRSWLSDFFTDAKARKGADIPLLPSFEQLK